MEKNAAVLYGEIVSKCWENEIYQEQFIADPESKFKEVGLPVEEGINYRVIREPAMVKYIVLPREGEGVAKSVQTVAKLLLNKSEKSDAIIPPGVEVRIIQDTQDTNFLVLPVSPKTLTPTELAMVAGGGTTVSVSEVAVQIVEVTEVATTGVSVAEAGMAVVVGAACVLI